jgi:hypothetical protein
VFAVIVAQLVTQLFYLAIESSEFLTLKLIAKVVMQACEYPTE